MGKKWFALIGKDSRLELMTSGIMLKLPGQKAAKKISDKMQVGPQFDFFIEQRH